MAKPHVLIVLDGWGHREAAADNAISQANTPVWDSLLEDRPNCLISASGTDVGLPVGQMGNSEVGHMNLGTGRIIDQDLTRISKAVDDGSFAANKVLAEQFDSLRNHNGRLHIFGLLSPGGVHSHENQIQAAARMAHETGVAEVCVHAFLDGRDVPPRSAELSVRSLESYLVSNQVGCIASVCGRFFGMDRDQRWERTSQAYHLIVDGDGEYNSPDPVSALQAAYERGETDEFVSPTSIVKPDGPITVRDGDGVLFMNFRADRARQLTYAFVDEGFQAFERKRVPALNSFVTLTRYADDIKTPCAFGPVTHNNGLGEYLAHHQRTQLRLAETEKFAHVTYFFSGGREPKFDGEQRTLVPSPKVRTYDLQPEMSAPEVTEQLVDAIRSNDFDLIVCNYANGDMVGHTGNLSAAIRAVECVDRCLSRVVSAVMESGAELLITADHGNVEQMLDADTGQAHTAHTSDLVPLIYVGQQSVSFRGGVGSLRDVAPTLLFLLDMPVPEEMTGSSLLESATMQAAS